MNRSMVEQVADAVLYEGYMLYPYRPSATKNKQRFTFGRVYPQAYSEDQNGRERCAMQTQVLVEGADPTVDLRLRFLHPMNRQVGRLPEPLAEWEENAETENVPELRVGGDLYQTWKEAVEQEIEAPAVSVKDLSGRPREIPFSFPDFHEEEPIWDKGDDDGNEQIVGVMTRRRQALDGVVELAAEPLTGSTSSSNVSRLTVRIVNRTPVPQALLDDQDAIVMRLLASAHTILRVQEGAFLSLMDPPPEYAEAADACENDGTWPVLVGSKDGDEAANQRDTMLSSPIILQDYPEIAPESPGDFFDGAEMDEMLALHIQAMTDEEKREMRSADERGREILERMENLPDEHLQKLHGTIREMRALGGSATGEEQNGKEKSVTVEGVTYRVGDRVRIQPGGGGGRDVMDLALDGMTAIIQAIEEDFENRVHFALVIEDDPGRDFGMDRRPGHRFFYGPDEVERLPRIEQEEEQP
jgi:hypothetical protein